MKAAIVNRFMDAIIAMSEELDNLRVAVDARKCAALTSAVYSPAGSYPALGRKRTPHAGSAMGMMAPRS